MAQETKKVITIDVGKSTATLKELKKQIEQDAIALAKMTEGTEEYIQASQELAEEQDILAKSIQLSRSATEAAEGSYNALCKQMAELKKEWKATNDEAQRKVIGIQINEINDQLKEMDASIGNYQRNVGNYEGAMLDVFTKGVDGLAKNNGKIGDIFKTIKDALPAIKGIGTSFKQTEQATAQASQGIQKSLLSSGIGAIVIVIGNLIGHLQDLRKFFAKGATAATELKEANDALNESFERQNVAIENEITLMDGLGVSTEEQRMARIRLIDTQLAEAQTSMDVTRAKIAEIEAHSWLRKILTGEKQDLEELNDLLKEQEKLEQSLYDTQQRLTTQAVAEQLKKDRERVAVLKDLTNGTKEYLNATQDLERAHKISAQVEEENVKMLESLPTRIEMSEQWVWQTRQLINQNHESFVQREAEILAEREQNYADFETAVVSTISSVATAWTSQVQAQVAAGKLSEQAAQNQFKVIKALNASSVLVDSMAAAWSAYKSAVAAAGTFGAVAGWAQFASIVAKGVSDMTAIKNMSLGSTAVVSTTSGGSQTASVQTQAYLPAVSMTRNLTSASEEERLNQMAGAQKVYVVATEVEAVGRRVAVQAAEATF